MYGCLEHHKRLWMQPEAQEIPWMSPRRRASCLISSPPWPCEARPHSRTYSPIRLDLWEQVQQNKHYDLYMIYIYDIDDIDAIYIYDNNTIYDDIMYIYTQNISVEINSGGESSRGGARSSSADAFSARPLSRSLDKASSGTRLTVSEADWTL